jgi:hypothetical protein
MEKQLMFDNDDNEHMERHRKADGAHIDYCKNNTSGKPIVVAVTSMANMEAASAYRAQVLTRFATSGIPAYSSTVSAARALSRFVAYHDFQSRANS